MFLIASFSAGGTFASFVVVVVWWWWGRLVIVAVAWDGFVSVNVDASFSPLAVAVFPISAFVWMPEVTVWAMVTRTFFVSSA